MQAMSRTHWPLTRVEPFWQLVQVEVWFSTQVMQGSLHLGTDVVGVGHEALNAEDTGSSLAGEAVLGAGLALSVSQFKSICAVEAAGDVVRVAG